MTAILQSDKYQCHSERNDSTQNYLLKHFNLKIQQVKPVLSKLTIGDQFAYNHCYNVRLRFKYNAFALKLLSMLVNQSHYYKLISNAEIKYFVYRAFVR